MSAAVLLWSDAAHPQLSTPYTANDVPLTAAASEVAYTIDLESLPMRPRLIVEAVPDAGHADMDLQVEISGCTLLDPNTFYPCTEPLFSTSGAEPRSVTYRAWQCEIANTFPAYVDETCNVFVRALDFGSNGPPATFDLSIRGVTEAPTATLHAEVTLNPQTAEIYPAKDTTLYEASATASNGAGESIWISQVTGADRLHSLIAFDVQSWLPPYATIFGARLQLERLGASDPAQIDLFAVPRHPLVDWIEGSANAAGDESTPPSPLTGAASWSHRAWSPATPLGPWSIPGGDAELPALASADVAPVGPTVLESPALVEYVRTILADSVSYDGLLLTSASGYARFGSVQNGEFLAWPRLLVDFDPFYFPLNDDLETGTVQFINEGQRFRWIYDLDQDNVLITPIDGRCEWFDPGGSMFELPYTYDYQGDPYYSGLDCCTWQIESKTGARGSGQAIFYINADSSNPANQPGDVDSDGIKDLCDSCPSTPNGPFLGTCLYGAEAGETCLSNQECAGAPCSLAQEDGDRNGTGDACTTVPEPGLLVALVPGLGALVGLARVRTTASSARRAA